MKYRPSVGHRASSAGCARAARPKGVLGSVEKSPHWLTLTLAQLPRRKAISRSTPFPRSRTMSERHFGPVSQTLRATGSTYRRRIGLRGRAGNCDKRRIADDVRWRYDAPGECILLGVRSPRECRSWCDSHRIMAIRHDIINIINAMITQASTSRTLRQDVRQPQVSPTAELL